MLRMIFLSPLLVSGLLLSATCPVVAQIDTTRVEETSKKQDKEIQDQSKTIEEQQKQLEEQLRMIRSLETRVDQLATGTGQGMSEDEVKLRERIERLESKVDQPDELPSNIVMGGDVPGSFRIPGTNASVKFGGFVRNVVAGNAAELGTSNRFIVATIPVGDGRAGEGARLSFTAEQSRLNIDLREATTKSQLRAFLEGDFVGDGETFRLRHAYGQTRQALAGKTWTLFMDLIAAPEDIDFEGLSGEVRLRQAQLRGWVLLGEKRSMELALEAPEAEVSGGGSVSAIPDLTARLNLPQGRFGHVQLAGVLRQMRAQPLANPDTTVGAFGWGLSFTGRLDIPWWEDHDAFSYQITGGEGIGHYMTDTRAAGGTDAVLDTTGRGLEALSAIGGYVGYQHWWRDNLQSNLVYTFTNVWNDEQQLDDAYSGAHRASINVVWTPINRIDLGLEFLWGQRRNKSGERGEAVQFQFVQKYRFSGSSGTR